jgi:DNA polymerase-1
MELRAAAEVSRDKAMLTAFRNGIDLHRATAAAMTGVKPAEVSKEQRTRAKCVNFGVLYGMGAEALAKYAWKNYELAISVGTAKQWLEQWAATYEGYIEWRRQHFNRCEMEGKIVIGRHAANGQGRVHLWAWDQPDQDFADVDDDADDDFWESESAASWTRSAAYPIQGVCADIGLVAIALIEDRLTEAGICGDCGLVGWVHDEFLVEVEQHDVEVAKTIIEQSMVEAFLWAFPDAPTLDLIDMNVGANWAETKDKEKKTAAPEFDIAAIHAERLKRLIRETPEGAPDDEPRARAYDYAVAACRAHYVNLSLEGAKARVLAAIKPVREG